MLRIATRQFRQFTIVSKSTAAFAPSENHKPKYTKLFINNKFVDAHSGKTFDTVNPANNKLIAKVAEADKTDVDIAVKAARKAFELGSEWRTMDASQRGILMNKLADLMERDAEILATLETIDNGKPYKVALAADIPLSISTIRYYAGYVFDRHLYADKYTGKTIPIDGNYFSYSRHEAIGVVGSITPWNFSLLMQIWKLAPAVAMGNTIVMKVAEQTPLTALHVAALSKEAGFPDGVINILPGFGHTAGSALSQHMDVDKIAFTGSTDVGRIIMADAAKSNLKKISLELGGKSPMIIFNTDDAGINEAVDIKYITNEYCSAGSRTFVQAGIYDKFVARFKEVVEKRKLGDPFDASVDQGPQIDNNQVETILKYIDIGKKEGARLVTGGKRYGTKGCFVEPTVFADVTSDMRIAQEEIFGPVACIIKFEDTKDIIAKANDTIYGLAAGVYTKDIDQALEVANNMRAGTVWVNCYDVFSPAAAFGGYGASGLGRDLGEYALASYTEVKTVTMKVNQKNS
uniref:Aldedh domain-containing protein n=1 Tax=Rhabditophanes sp. KR3021 TaxID=114890 RepID=A0AC35UBH7_9BILA